MIGWLLMGLLAASVAVIVVSGILNKSKVRDVMKDKGIKKGIINMIENSDNVIQLKDMDTGTEYKIQGDDLSDELRKGDVIYV